uniref:Uncharacterized protein n=1 Tax=Cacopsylla melanoneura TaxID=428564 RepID=A0A8D8Y9D1_9HEMI
MAVITIESTPSILVGLSLTLDEDELVPKLHSEVLLPLGVVSMEVLGACGILQSSSSSSSSSSSLSSEEDLPHAAFNCLVPWNEADLSTDADMDSDVSGTHTLCDISHLPSAEATAPAVPFPPPVTPFPFFPSAAAFIGS